MAINRIRRVVIIGREPVFGFYAQNEGHSQSRRVGEGGGSLGKMARGGVLVRRCARAPLRLDGSGWKERLPERCVGLTPYSSIERRTMKIIFGAKVEGGKDENGVLSWKARSPPSSAYQDGVP